MLGLPQYGAMDSWAGHIKPKVVHKPIIVTRDQVHASLVEAVKRGIDSTDRLVMVEEESASTNGREHHEPGPEPVEVAADDDEI